MKLLIIGGSGFIGRNVIERLAGGGHPFRHVTATFSRTEGFPSWARQRGIEPLAMDLSRSVQLAGDFDVAIYTAGNADHGTAAERPLVDLDLNAAAMLRFLDTFHGRLVYLSSGAVYYGLSGSVDPKRRLQPTFAYGISKYAAELYAGAARSRNGLASLAIVRLFYAFGRHDKTRRLVPRLVRAAADSTTATFRVNGTGGSLIDPLDAAVVAEVLLRMAARPHIEGIFDLCGGGPRTVLEFAREVVDVAGGQLDVQPSGEREEFPVTFCASPEKILAAVDFALPPLRVGVQRTVDWLAASRGAPA